MKSLHKQRGFWNFIIPAAASLIGGMISNRGQQSTNESNQGINSAQMAFNAEEAEKTRAFNSAEAGNQRNWQEKMRATQYQTAMGDMGAAGLNPMLAFQQGGAGTPSGGQASGPAASAGSMIPMQNKTQAGINGAIAAAQIANVNSQTKVNEQTAEKIAAETPNVIASTGQIKQQTANLEEGLKKITEEIKNVKMDTLEKEERVTLIRAQQQLANVQKELANKQITFTEAQTRTQNVLTMLRNYETEGAKNEAAFERKLGENTGVGASAFNNIINFARRILGK